jgi:hypothetical protein
VLDVELDGAGADDGDEVDDDGIVDEVGDVVGVLVEAVVDDVVDVVVDELVIEELPPLHELNTVATITSPQKPMTICAFG